MLTLPNDSFEHRLTQLLLKDSASPSLVACADLAAAHEPLGKRLFVAAFVSCWSEISPAHQVYRLFIDMG